MTTSLAGANVMLLIANGFNEAEFADVQRALLKAGAKLKTIAPENSLANGWLGNGWGHYFPVDKHIGETLGSDYDMLVLVGGTRGVAKLQQNAHTSRIIGHFLDAYKPVAALNEAIALLAPTGKLYDRAILADDAAEGQLTSGAILTAKGSDVATLVSAVMEHLADSSQLMAA